MKSLYSFTAACVVLILLLPTFSFGQASQAEMQSFPMPPPSGYFATKTFAAAGDYGYFTAPTSSLQGTTSNFSDYKYVRYSGVTDKNVVVYGAWGPTPIAPATPSGDNCFHAHTSYGVWGRWELKGLPWTSSGWTFLGGGGMSGKRNASGKCVLDTNNSLSSFDSRFGWGRPFLTFDWQFRFFSFYREYKEFVVGVLSNTHGWGSCAPLNTGFTACFEPSYIIGYTLP